MERTIKTIVMLMASIVMLLAHSFLMVISLGMGGLQGALIWVASVIFFAVGTYLAIRVTSSSNN